VTCMVVLEIVFLQILAAKNLQHCMLVKYLGVIMDSRLTWKEHVDVKVKKAQNCGPVV